MNTIYKKSETKKSEKHVTERIKTFDDACEALGLDMVQIGVLGMAMDMESITAYLKLIIIIRALNEGWKPDWNDTEQPKYFPWFRFSSSNAGLAFSNTNLSPSFALTSFGSRLCFKSPRLAKYAGKQFIEIYLDYLLIK
jgi:hypothetical protein